MKEVEKKIIIKYAICFIVASLITVAVFWSSGFFTDNIGVNLQIWADGVSVSGILLLLLAGLMFVSSEGALLGIGFVMKSVVMWFVPMGRMQHETYAQYRQRKLGKIKKAGDNCVLVTGLIFLAIGIILNIIWYTNFYNIV